MTRTIYILVLCLIGTSSFSQNALVRNPLADGSHLSERTATNECLLDSVLEYYEGSPSYRWLYQYDADGNLIEMVTQSWNGVTATNG